MVDIEDLWRRMDAQIAAQTPQFDGLFNPPATDPEIAELEAHIGMLLPPSIRDSYRVHNGECDDSDGLFNVWKFLPLTDVARWWDEMKLIESTHGLEEFDASSMIPVMLMEGDLRYVQRSINREETFLIEWNHGSPICDIVGV